MRITVMGTGALACLAGARLAMRGADVTLAGTWRDGLAAIASGGIRLLDSGTETVVNVRAMPRAALASGADLVLVVVKSYQTAEAAPDAARASAADGVILTLQNGLGNREMLARFADSSRVAAGATTVGATLVAPGSVRAGGIGDTVLGPDSAGNGPNARQLNEIAALLTDAGFAARRVDNVDPWLWAKLVVNAAINPLSAILGAPNGALLLPEARAVLLAAAREAADVALAEGVVFPHDPVAESLRIAERTAANRSSMLQDVSRDTPTEIAAISGEVLRRGRAHGMRTPVTEWLVAQVAEIEAGRSAEPLSNAPIGASPATDLADQQPSQHVGARS